MDAKTLNLLLDIELACTFMLQRCTVSPARGVQRGAPAQESTDEIPHRIAVALAKLSTTCEGARDLLSRGEWDAVGTLAAGGPRTTAHDAARRVLLAAVPRLFFETQAMISEGREPWQPEGAKRRGPGWSRGLHTPSPRASHT